MADKTISELPAAPSALTDYDGTELFVLEQSSTAKKLRMQILENWLVSIANGHGGIQSIEKTGTTGTNPVVDTYTITLADETEETFTVTNGVKGDTGSPAYVYIRWSSAQPTSDSDMGVVPAPWIGIYAGFESNPSNLHYTDFTWYEYKGDTGDTGVGIGSVELTSQSGLVDTYTVYSDEDTPQALGTFTVINGSGGVDTVDGAAPDASGNVVTALLISDSITAFPKTISDARITAAMRVAEVSFGTPSAVVSDITWTTSAGEIVLSGTLAASSSTTVEIILIQTTT